MPREHILESVHSSKDKQRTYQAVLAKYRLAMRYGFYLQAILIDYALMEDRLSSFIYHVGWIDDLNETKVNKTGRRYLRQWMPDYDSRKSPRIDKLANKKAIIRIILDWEESSADPTSDRYLRVLRSRLESLDVGGIIDIIGVKGQTDDKMSLWCKYRNDCIHTLMNRNIAGLDEELAARADEGMQYVRFIDAQINILRRQNAIRRSRDCTDV